MTRLILYCRRLMTERGFDGLYIDSMRSDANLLRALGKYLRYLLLLVVILT